MTTTTEVSKSNPTIKQILTATVGSAWKGRRVSIVEASRGWEHTQYIDDQMHGWYLNLDTLVHTGQVRVRQTQRPTYGGPNLVHKRPEGSEAFVIRERFMGKDMGVEIVVPDTAIDQGALSVATDALLEKNKKAAATTLARLGVFSGIAMAIAEAHVKTFGKASGVAPTTKRSAAQLQREIDAVLRRRA